MPSPKLRKLQDEAATLSKEIHDLRSLEPKDEAEAAGIAERLADAEGRADKVAAAAKRERELDERLAALDTVTAASTPAGELEGDKRKAGNLPAGVAMLGGVSIHRSEFSCPKRKRELGLVLRNMARNRSEFRADMGETSPEFDGAGAELIMTELYPSVINTLNYAAVMPRLALNVEMASNKIRLPKAGDITVDFVDENTATEGQAISTDAETLELGTLRAEVPVSNEALEDNFVAIPGIIAQKGGAGFARKIDSVWLTGHVGRGIDGLVDLIDEAHTVDNEGGETTKAMLASLIGKVENTLNAPAWIVSAVGWGELMAVYAGQTNSMMVGGGAPVMTIAGVPIFKVEGLPAGTLAIYGDFASASAFGYKPSGFAIETLRELGARKNQTIFNLKQRVGILNHAPEFCAKLIDSTLEGS